MLARRPEGVDACVLKIHDVSSHNGLMSKECLLKVDHDPSIPLCSMRHTSIPTRSEPIAGQKTENIQHFCKMLISRDVLDQEAPSTPDPDWTGQPWAKHMPPPPITHIPHTLTLASPWCAPHPTCYQGIQSDIRMCGDYNQIRARGVLLKDMHVWCSAIKYVCVCCSASKNPQGPLILVQCSRQCAAQELPAASRGKKSPTPQIPGEPRFRSYA